MDFALAYSRNGWWFPTVYSPNHLPEPFAGKKDAENASLDAMQELLSIHRDIQHFES